MLQASTALLLRHPSTPLAVPPTSDTCRCPSRWAVLHKTLSAGLVKADVPQSGSQVKTHAPHHRHELHVQDQTHYLHHHHLHTPHAPHFEDPDLVVSEVSECEMWECATRARRPAASSPWLVAIRPWLLVQGIPQSLSSCYNNKSDNTTLNRRTTDAMPNSEASVPCFSSPLPVLDSQVALACCPPALRFPLPPSLPPALSPSLPLPLPVCLCV